VAFRGVVSQAELPDLLATASVCVYPSHMEAMPVAWLEGLAMGKAIVASQTGPGREAIEHGVSGWLCDPHDPGSIAEAVTLLLRDRSLRQRLGRAARIRALKHFSRHRILRQNEALYERCLSVGLA
jgi:glycosyltransferase involved in cell wall biosynthesis